MSGFWPVTDLTVHGQFPTQCGRFNGKRQARGVSEAEAVSNLGAELPRQISRGRFAQPNNFWPFAEAESERRSYAGARPHCFSP